jgi:hypothetical protein
MRGRVVAVLAVALATSACVSTPRENGGTERNLIERPEIEATRANNAFEVVEQLRPTFLRGRPVSTGNQVTTVTPLVYLDGTRLGELQQLQTIPVAIILTIQLISAGDATTRWGTGHPVGVIEVKTRR